MILQKKALNPSVLVLERHRCGIIRAEPHLLAIESILRHFIIFLVHSENGSCSVTTIVCSQMLDASTKPLY